MKRLSAWALSVLICGSAAAQLPDDEPYYPYAEAEERIEDPHSDSALFYRAIRSSEPLYEALTDYNLPRVTLRRRGEDRYDRIPTLMGVALSMRQLTLLRALGGVEQARWGMDAGRESSALAGERLNFEFDKSLPLNPYAVTAQLTDRNYRFSGRVQMHRMVGRWQLGAAIDARVGDDLHIEGVYTRSLSAAVRLSRSWSSGAELTLYATLPLVERGLRSSSTEEAFRLVDDPYYNPAWGLREGKVFNARIRREQLPFAVVAWQQPLGEATTMRLTVGGEYGLQRQSALGWYDARSPLPDNYRYMPSYVEDRTAEEAWRAADPRYTQIDWDELVAQNRMRGGEAIYALEDRVSRPLRLTAVWGVEHRMGAVELDGGVRFACLNTRYYKEMRDLLGAGYLTDIDQYLIDDDSYNNRLENNLRSPSRKIAKGDRFGYDYALRELNASLWVRGLWRTDRLYGSLTGEVGQNSHLRRGYYEKELFPSSGSYGKSRSIRLATYALRLAAGWSFSPRSYLELRASTGREAPDTEHLFVQPLYNNRTVEEPTAEQFHALQLGYRRRSEKLDVELTAFLSRRSEGVESVRYYDDLAAAYADLTIADLATQSYGVEGALAWRPAYRWTLSAAASWSENRYVENPSITVLRDTDNAPIDVHAVSHLRDCRIGGAPTVTATLAVRYYGPKGWGFRLSGGYAGGRYVDVAPLRRTDRVAYQAGVTPETFAAFTRQERLSDAFTLDLALYKRLYFERSSLLVTLQANNLTGDESPSYGYESLRSQRMGIEQSALRIPQPTRYLYALPRSCSLRVAWYF